MKILIACETSGLVRDALRAQGHDAVSCDILPTDVPGPHIQGDARTVLSQGWDMMIAHPPCTYLCSSGMHWTSRGLRNPRLTEDTLAFARILLEAPIPLIAIENPVGAIGSRIRPASQYVQPYEFGDDASKRTGLWLKGLPALIKDPARRVAGRLVEWPKGSGKLVERWSNQTDSGQNREPPRDNRWKIRSQTYPGIAAAMAAQWGTSQEFKLAA